jgi:lysozyme
VTLKQRLLGGGAAVLLSVAGFAALQRHEGLRLIAYPDPATGGAPWTICYGHTGKEVYRGLTVSKDQCVAWLREDVAEAESYLRQYVRVPLRQGQWDAYVSFVYNAGPENFRKSTMLRLLNAGQALASCQQFPHWKYANKKVLDGIVKRRYEEQTMCLQSGPYVYHPSN